MLPSTNKTRYLLMLAAVLTWSCAFAEDQCADEFHYVDALNNTTPRFEILLNSVHFDLSGGAPALASIIGSGDIGEEIYVCGAGSDYVCFVSRLMQFAAPHNLFDESAPSSWEYNGIMYRVTNDAVQAEEWISRKRHVKTIAQPSIA